MKTRILFDDNVRQKFLSGVEKIANAVTSTLGPKGQNVLISRPYGPPNVVHDGVTVAESINLEDEDENQASTLLKDAAQQTNAETGDGTTSNILLASEMFKNGVRQISTGANGMELRKGMKEALKDALAIIDKKARKIKKSEWEEVASISAQDKEIGAKIAEAFKLTGKDGSIQVESGSSDVKIEIEYQKGLSLESGFASEYLVTDITTQSAIYKDARVLITDKPLMSDADLHAIANIVKTEKRPILLMAESYNPRVLNALVTNRIKNGLQIVAVTAPKAGDERKSLLEDVATATGAKLISGTIGMRFSDATVSDLGSAEKVVVDKNSTMITFSDTQVKNEVKERIKSIKHEIKNSKNEFEKEMLTNRIAKLSGGIAVIFTGGKTQAENRELRERVYDAVGATRSAIESGVVVGGGTILYQIHKELKSKHGLGEFAAGYNIVIDALKKPLEKLAINSNKDPGRIMEQLDIMSDMENNENLGFNAIKGEISDLLKDKVLDPVKVVKVSLENAVSAAGSLITASCAVIAVQEDKKE